MDDLHTLIDEWDGRRLSNCNLNLKKKKKKNSSYVTPQLQAVLVLYISTSGCKLWDPHSSESPSHMFVFGHNNPSEH